MIKRALGAFEPDVDGNWHCRRTITVRGPHGDVVVKAGTRIAKRAVFAGFNDFTDHLEKIAVEVPSLGPQGWKESMLLAFMALQTLDPILDTGLPFI